MFTCTIDFSKCKTLDDLYDTLYKALEVPDWCGHNLSALWDVLTGFIDPPTDITILGIESLSSELKHRVLKMIKIFERAKEYDISYKIE